MDAILLFLHPGMFDTEEELLTLPVGGVGGILYGALERYGVLSPVQRATAWQSLADALDVSVKTVQQVCGPQPAGHAIEQATRVNACRWLSRLMPKCQCQHTLRRPFPTAMKVACTERTKLEFYLDCTIETEQQTSIVAHFTAASCRDSSFLRTNCRVQQALVSGKLVSVEYSLTAALKKVEVQTMLTFSCRASMHDRTGAHVLPTCEGDRQTVIVCEGWQLLTIEIVDEKLLVSVGSGTVCTLIPYTVPREMCPAGFVPSTVVCQTSSVTQWRKLLDLAVHKPGTQIDPPIMWADVPRHSIVDAEVFGTENPILLTDLLEDPLTHELVNRALEAVDAVQSDQNLFTDLFALSAIPDCNVRHSCLTESSDSKESKGRTTLQQVLLGW